MGMKSNYKSLKQLFIPTFMEILFLMLVGSIDTIMLSYVGDDAVGGVGTANTYMGIFLITFSIISSGMVAVMTQYIGNGKPGAAKQARNIGALCNVSLGLVLSVILVFFAGPILRAIGIAEALYVHAKIYIQIVGGTCILNAVIPIANSYLRAFGYIKEPLAGTILSNAVNLVLNAVLLYGVKMGVAGVAIATVTARIINFLFTVTVIMKKIHIPEEEERIPNKLLFKQIISIGFPAALETTLYNAAMTLVVMFLNKMDSDGMNVTARSYAGQITNFSYAAGAALAQANAIITGWKIGEHKYDECHRDTIRTARYGIIAALGFSIVIAMLGKPLMSLFTDDPEMIRLVQTILIVDIALEIGRVSNIVYGNALKVCGDAVYTVTLAIIFMYVFAVFGTYLLGLRLELMAVGAWIALALDECARSVFMYLRWNSRKWEKKVLVK